MHNRSSAYYFNTHDKQRHSTYYKHEMACWQRESLLVDGECSQESRGKHFQMILSTELIIFTRLNSSFKSNL